MTPFALLIVLLVPFLVHLLRRSLQPRPLPGIPVGYPAGATTIPWFSGFAKHLSQAVRQGRGRTAFFTECGEGLSVYQIPVGPAGTWLARWLGLGTNLVCCKDIQEMDEACGRRSNAFARVGMTFAVAVPRSHIVMHTGPEFRHHRRVVGPAMKGEHLARVLPRIEKSVDGLIRLWRERDEAMRKRTGEDVVEVKEDLLVWASDVILSLALGIDMNGIGTATEHVKKATASANSRPAPHRYLAAIYVLFDQIRGSVSAGPLSPLHRWYHSHLNTKTRAARAELVRLADGRIAEERAVRSGAAGPAETDHVLGVVLEVEQLDLAKGLRPLEHEAIRDELLLFVIGGAETVAANLAWAVKFFSRAPSVQQRLRDELAASLPAAFVGGGRLEYDDLQDERALPYLHAVVWEILRAASTGGMTLRKATEDASLLGHPVPKGTTVVFVTSWMSSRAGDGEDKERDEAYTAAGARGGGNSGESRRCGYWSDADVRRFRPERWLRQDEDGTERFDRNAGPWAVFGSGVRRCFGQNLAILELKVAVAKLIGAFFFEPVPSSLDTDGVAEVLTRLPVQASVRLRPY